MIVPEITFSVAAASYADSQVFEAEGISGYPFQGNRSYRPASGNNGNDVVGTDVGAGMAESTRIFRAQGNFIVVQSVVFNGIRA